MMVVVILDISEERVTTVRRENETQKIKRGDEMYNLLFNMTDI